MGSLLALSAAARATPLLAHLGGSVVMPQAATLPAGTTLALELLDLSQADGKPGRLALLVLPAGGRAAPLSFELPFYPADVTPGHHYLLRATLVREGERLFAGEQAVPLPSGTSSVQLAVQAASATAAAPMPRATLENTYWKLIDLDGRTAQQLPGERAAYMLLLSGRASGGSGCNKLMGAYALEGPQGLRLGPLARTRTVCPPEMMTQEAALLDAFDHTTSYRIEGETLTLLQGERVLARFAAGDFR